MSNPENTFDQIELNFRNSVTERLPQASSDIAQACEQYLNGISNHGLDINKHVYTYSVDDRNVKNIHLSASQDGVSVMLDASTSLPVGVRIYKGEYVDDPAGGFYVIDQDDRFEFIEKDGVMHMQAAHLDIEHFKKTEEFRYIPAVMDDPAIFETMMREFEDVDAMIEKSVVHHNEVAARAARYEEYSIQQNKPLRRIGRKVLKLLDLS